MGTPGASQGPGAPEDLARTHTLLGNEVSLDCLAMSQELYKSFHTRPRTSDSGGIHMGQELLAILVLITADVY